MLTGHLWIAFTLIASAAQTFRNALQRDLIGTVGTLGATYVRFLFGLPFSVVFLAIAAFATGLAPPMPGPPVLLWLLGGAVAQITATALMLAAMKQRSLVVTTAYTKTEPVQLALFGLVFLGDHFTWTLALAILTATAGVVLMSWPKTREGDRLKPALLGLASASFFALSAIGYRGGILGLPSPSFIMQASTALVLGLSMQSAIILIYLAAFDRAMLGALLAAWRPSLLAGFMGAFASQFWFLSFALTAAARVRTLALVEVVFAQIISRKMLRQQVSGRELTGMALTIIGVIVLLNT